MTGMLPKFSTKRTSWGNWFEIDDRKAVISAVKRLVPEHKTKNSQVVVKKKVSHAVDHHMNGAGPQTHVTSKLENLRVNDILRSEP